MSAVQRLLTEHIAIWTAADNEKRSGRGRAPVTAGSVYGIKQLRELIFELAVRGKLVAQDMNDEPASELVKRIEDEKRNLAKNGRTRKVSSVPIADREKPFNIPKNWAFVRLGEICSDVQYGFTDSANHQSKEVLFLRITDIQNDAVNWDTVPGCGVSVEETFGYELQNDDIVIARTGGTIGKSYLVSGLSTKAIFASYLIRLGNLASTSATYKKVFLGSRLYWQQLYANSMGTGQPNVNGTALKGLIISLPPLAEQRRIVAKVDELMALCDQLEAQHSDAAEAHEKLVGHLLSTLTNSEDAEDFSANWQRIAAHFDTLFTSESSIDDLKQTLLQLAVMGKLVSQDTSDEPASNHIKQIEAEKSELAVSGKVKKEKSPPTIREKEKPFILPQGWKWCRLSELLAMLTDGDHQPPPKALSGVPFLVIGNLNTGRVTFEDSRFVPLEYYEKLDWGKRPQRNDILYTVTGSYGIPITVDVSEPFCVQRHVAIFKSVPSTPVRYVSYLLKSKYAFEYATNIATGIAQKTVPLTGLRLLPVALPTLPEQHRIVAKVDELMALCDQLKLRLTDANQLKRKLADVLVQQAL